MTEEDDWEKVCKLWAVLRRRKGEGEEGSHEEKKSYFVAVVLGKNKDSREKAARCLCCSRAVEKNACHCEWKSVTLLKESCLSK